ASPMASPPPSAPTSMTPRPASSTSSAGSTAPPPTMASGPSHTTKGPSAFGTEVSCTVTEVSLSVGCLAGVFRGSGAESYPLNLNQVMLAEEVRDGKGLLLTCAIDTNPFSHDRTPLKG